MKPFPRLTRLSWLSAAAAILLLVAACAPQAANVYNTVMPQIFSIRSQGDSLFIQGRYLGSGQGSIEAGNYVLIGANALAEGGMVYPAVSWTNSRIEVPVPAAQNLGHVFVYVDGVPSNGLPVNRQ